MGIESKLKTFQHSLAAGSAEVQMAELCVTRQKLLHLTVVQSLSLQALNTNVHVAGMKHIRLGQGSNYASFQ